MLSFLAPMWMSRQDAAFRYDRFHRSLDRDPFGTIDAPPPRPG